MQMYIKIFCIGLLSAHIWCQAQDELETHADMPAQQHEQYDLDPYEDDGYPDYFSTEQIEQTLDHIEKQEQEQTIIGKFYEFLLKVGALIFVPVVDKWNSWSKKKSAQRRLERYITR